jgi:hypothetical protein
MKTKDLLTAEIFHSLKERKNLFTEGGLSQPENTFPKFINSIEVAFWGFVPSRGTLQQDFLLYTEEKEASCTPGSFYNPVTERFSLWGSKMS